MTEDTTPATPDPAAALRRKQMIARIVVFALVIGFALLKPKVDAWLASRDKTDDVVQNDAANADPGSITIRDSDDPRHGTSRDGDFGEIFLETTDPGIAPANEAADAAKTSGSFPTLTTTSPSAAGTQNDGSQTTATKPTSNNSSKTTDRSPPARNNPFRNSKPSVTTKPSGSSGSTTKQEPPPGKLTLVRGRDTFRSTAGLMYVPGSQDGHRLKHVLKHTKDDLDKPVHGVYATTDRDKVLAWIDMAYIKGQKGGKGVRVENQRGRVVYTVDMGEMIGYVGGQAGKRKGKPSCKYLRLVVQNENEVVTAYPSQSL